MEAGELADTSFKFGEDDPSYDQGSRTLTFKLAKRTFEPDEEITTKKGITYIAVGPNHQYGLTGPLGLVSNFHAVGFSKVTNGAHTNGNILTKKLNYKNNFGTNGLTGEISYIRSFESIAAGMMCGDGSDDILVLGKDIDVTWAGNTFYLNGQKLTRPMTIYQDTEEYQYLDIDTAKEEAESLSSQFGALPDAGVTFENKTFKVSNDYSGMTVINVGHDMLGTEALAIEGLHNQSGTSLLINVRVPKGTEEITIPNISINGTSSGSGEVIDFSAGKVIWNVVYEDGTSYTGKVSNGGAVAGTILVPDGKVHAAHNWNGSLIADEIEITGETHRTDFTGMLGFGVSKVLKGRDWKLSDRFQIELSAKEGTPMPIGSKTREGVQKKIISVTYSNRSPSFGGITYGTADIGKTYQYTLKELEGNIKDIIYSEAVYTVQVSIQSNNGQGLLIIKKYSKNGGKTWEDKMPEEDVFEFTNVSGVEFKVKKKYNSTYPGKDDDNVFKFVLKGLNGAPMPEKDENAPEEPNDQKTIIVTSSEEVSFDSITYKEDGTYKYEISEVKGKINGVTYDEKVYDVKVEVSKDENGTKVIKVRSREKGAEDAEYKLLEKGTVFTAEFTNTYDDASAEITVSGTKTLTGRDLKADEFEFSLTPVSAVAEDGTAITDSNAAQTAKNDKDGNIVFEKLNYTEAGTYTYSVKEIQGSDEGIEYSNASYDVTVVVKNGEKSLEIESVKAGETVLQKNAEEAYDLPNESGKDASFVNRVKKGSLAITKTVDAPEGTEMKTGEYIFKVTRDGKEYDKDGNQADGAVIKVKAGETVTVSSLPIGSYKVTEVDAEKAGYTWTVEVNGETGSETTVAVPDKGTAEAKYTNTYKEFEGIFMKLEGTKKLEGRALTAGEFQFEVSLKSGEAANVTLPSETITNTADGKISISGIGFEKAGTYVLTVKEKAGSDAGMEYSNASYDVTVVVKNGEKSLEIESVKAGETVLQKNAEEAYDLPNESGKDASFVNRVKKGSLAITKTVDAPEGTEMKTGEYIFKVTRDGKEYDKDGNQADGAVIKVKAGETVTVSSLPIGSYKVTEVDAEKAGYTWTVKVEGENGNSKEVAIIDKETKSVEFVNTYTKHGAAEIVAIKRINGNPPAESEFTFKLYKDSIKEENRMETQTRTGAGKVQFGTQTYTEAGTYVYKVKEEAGNVKGYEYDESVYTVTVVVTNVDNKLESTVTYVKDGTSDVTTDAGAAEAEESGLEAAIFTNTYKPAKTTAVFTAEKKVEGPTIADDTFTFELFYPQLGVKLCSMAGGGIQKSIWCF